LRRWIADIATLRRVRGIGALLGRAAEADYPKLIGWVGTINPPAVTRALAAVDEARIRTTALDRAGEGPRSGSSAAAVARLSAGRPRGPAGCGSL